MKDVSSFQSGLGLACNPLLFKFFSYFIKLQDGLFKKKSTSNKFLIRFHKCFTKYKIIFQNFLSRAVVIRQGKYFGHLMWYVNIHVILPDCEPTTYKMLITYVNVYVLGMKMAKKL